MPIDRREDAGDFYPGGKVISTRPVATGGDVKHSDFAGLDVKTNTIPDLREAVRELGRRLGATVVTALAVCVASAATVQTVPVNDLDFDANPSVVTNVVFDAPPDFSTNNTELVETIEATAPAPGDYAAVSNAAMNAVSASVLAYYLPRFGGALYGNLILRDPYTPDNGFISGVTGGIGLKAGYGIEFGYGTPGTVGIYYEWSDDLATAHLVITNANYRWGDKIANMSDVTAVASDVAAAVNTKRYAMFIIPVNYDNNGIFTDFELKATTNNFARGVTSNLLFYAQSTCADTAENGWDKMKLFTGTSIDSADVRSYTYIANTAFYTNYLRSVVVVVDAQCLLRHPGDWLRDNNDELIWTYLRVSSMGMEEEKGTTRTLWIPTAPVRWFKKLPKWADVWPKSE